MGIRVKAIYVGNFYEELKDKVVIIEKYSDDNTACEVAYRDGVYDCWETDLKVLQLEFRFMNEST